MVEKEPTPHFHTVEITPEQAKLLEYIDDAGTNSVTVIAVLRALEEASYEPAQPISLLVTLSAENVTVTHATKEDVTWIRRKNELRKEIIEATRKYHCYKAEDGTRTTYDPNRLPNQQFYADYNINSDHMRILGFAKEAIQEALITLYTSKPGSDEWNKGLNSLQTFTTRYLNALVVPVRQLNTTNPDNFREDWLSRWQLPLSVLQRYGVTDQTKCSDQCRFARGLTIAVAEELMEQDKYSGLNVTVNLVKTMFIRPSDEVDTHTLCYIQIVQEDGSTQNIAWDVSEQRSPIAINLEEGETYTYRQLGHPSDAPYIDSKFYVAKIKPTLAEMQLKGADDEHTFLTRHQPPAIFAIRFQNDALAALGHPPISIRL